MAIEFAKRNALLVLWDINEAENNQTNELLKATGYRRARLFTIDITNEEQLKQTSQKVKTQIGDVSLIVTTATKNTHNHMFMLISPRHKNDKNFDGNFKKLYDTIINIW